MPLFLLPLALAACTASPDHIVAGQGPATSREYFVAPAGDDANPGTRARPFRTINRAADVAMPGDTVTVRAGTYREWVKPQRGGTGEDARITYRAAPGEDVRILGSERVTGWQRQADSTWLLVLGQEYFGGFNPFNTLTRHPQYIEQDEEGDGWGWLKYGRWTHLGDVFIDGQGLTEKQTPAEVAAEPLSWHTRTENGETYIRANFGGRNPNRSAVEINRRPYAFFPEQPGLGYITLQGFIIMNVASHWAPPVPYQPGAVGPNGGHHWNIEDNIIAYVKGVGVSLGNPTGPADRTASGHHRVVDNIILRCGQAGIAGQSWNHHSLVAGNLIEDINYREEFGGWETAGIKLHQAGFTRIEDNLIRKVHTVDPEIGAAHGIWIDYGNRNVKVSGNTVIGAEGNALLAEANFEGPNLYANNVLVGGRAATYSSVGDAWVHNLFIDTVTSWENQGWGNRPAIAHSRWFNNLFVGDQAPGAIEGEDLRFRNNVLLGAASPGAEAGVVDYRVRGGSYRLDDNGRGLQLVLEIPSELSSRRVPLVDSERLALDFGFDAVVRTGFGGRERAPAANPVGPFAVLADGEQVIALHAYSPRHRLARRLVGAGD